MRQRRVNRAVELLIVCDFGAPLGASAQSKKTIVIEAARSGDGRYRIAPAGRNERLVRRCGSSRHWADNCRGWTIPSLARSLTADREVIVASFDFPFSIPYSLLQNPTFAGRVSANAFCTRANWIRFLETGVDLAFASERADARLRLDPALQSWKDKKFWAKRATDIATNAQPALKDKFQNLFNMTVIGSRFLEWLSSGGMQIVLSRREKGRAVERAVIETYPGAVAKAVGFEGNYKQKPEYCLEAA